MNKPFSDLKVIELAGVLAGPSAGLFFAELGAKVIKIENPKTGGDVTRSWKLQSENKEDKTSAYYWSINAGKEVLFLDLSSDKDLQSFYDLIKTTDVLIIGGDDPYREAPMTDEEKKVAFNYKSKWARFWIVFGVRLQISF